MGVAGVPDSHYVNANANEVRHSQVACTLSFKNKGDQNRKQKEKITKMKKKRVEALLIAAGIDKQKSI